MSDWQMVVTEGERLQVPDFGVMSDEVWMVYPLKHGGSKWGNWELRLSLRSVERHWRGRLDGVIVLGSRLPKWANAGELQFRLAPGYIEALEAVWSLPGRVIWMNDDLAFMKPSNLGDLLTPREHGLISRAAMVRLENSANGWQQRKGKVARWLRERHGETVWDYSTHTPYLYEGPRLKWLMGQGLSYGYKTAVELAYFNLFAGAANRPCDDVWRPGGNQVIPESCDHLRFWNLTDGAVGDNHGNQLLRGFTRGFFPWKSRYEA